MFIQPEYYTGSYGLAGKGRGVFSELGASRKGEAFIKVSASCTLSPLTITYLPLHTVRL